MIAKKPIRGRVRAALERLADGWRALSGLTLAGLLEGSGLALMEGAAWGMSAAEVERRALERLEVVPWR